MINRQLSRLLLCSILGSTTLISGCALVRKDSAPHQQLKPEQIKLADDIHLASSGWPQAQWWKQLNDPQLDALIQRTLSGSHTLAEAKLREEKAQSQADLLDAGSQLQVAALGMLNRQRVSANGFLSPYAMDAPALGMDGPYYTEATVGLFAGLDLDLWGVHRSAVAAAIGAHNAALAETAAVELSLTTGVAQLYYSMQASYQMLDLLEQTRDVIDYAVKAHQSKVAHGLEAQVPFHGARAQILAVDKQIAAVKGQITETRESLRALIGAGASDMPEIKPVALPRVQTGIPATLSAFHHAGAAVAGELGQDDAHLPGAAGAQHLGLHTGAVAGGLHSRFDLGALFGAEVAAVEVAAHRRLGDPGILGKLGDIHKSNLLKYIDHLKLSPLRSDNISGKNIFIICKSETTAVVSDLLFHGKDRNGKRHLLLSVLRPSRSDFKRRNTKNPLAKRLGFFVWSPSALGSERGE